MFHGVAPPKMRKQSQVGDRKCGQASPYLSLVVGVAVPLLGDETTA